MNLHETAERIVKDLNLDSRDVDYLETVLNQVAREAVDYETEQGYYSTVIADAELEAAERERERLKEKLIKAAMRRKEYEPRTSAVIFSSAIAYINSDD